MASASFVFRRLLKIRLGTAGCCEVLRGTTRYNEIPVGTTEYHTCHACSHPKYTVHLFLATGEFRDSSRERSTLECSAPAPLGKSFLQLSWPSATNVPSCSSQGIDTRAEEVYVFSSTSCQILGYLCSSNMPAADAAARLQRYQNRLQRTGNCQVSFKV